MLQELEQSAVDVLTNIVSDMTYLSPIPRATFVTYGPYVKLAHD